MKLLPHRLKTLRAEAHLSQRELAASFGMPQTTWNNYEQGKSQPGIELADRICSTFKVNFEWLLLGRGPMRPGESAEAESPSGDIRELQRRIAVLEEENRLLMQLAEARKETIDAYRQAMATRGCHHQL